MRDREKPAVIITDFMMPVMDGLKFATAGRLPSTKFTYRLFLMSGAQRKLVAKTRFGLCCITTAIHIHLDLSPS